MASDDVIIRLRVRGENLTAETRAALAGVESEVEKQGQAAGGKLGGGLAAGLRSQATAITAIAGGIAGAVGAAINHAFRTAADLTATSRQIGISIESLQEWRNAARLMGADAGALETNIGKLTLRIGQATAGNREAQNAFADLGVSFQDISGHGRSTGDVMRSVIERLSEIDDPARRAALGTQLLGDEYQKIDPLARAGAAGIDQMNVALHEQNGVLTAEQVAVLNQANAEYERLQQILSVNIAGVVAENAGSIEGMISAIGRLTSTAFQWLSIADRFYASLEGSGEVYAPGLARLRNQDLRRRGMLPEDPNYVRTDGRDDAVRSPFLGGQSDGEFLSRFRRAPALPTNIPAAAPARAARGGGGGGGRRAGGGGGGNGGADRERREAERAAQERERTLARQEESLQRQLETLSDAARIDALRANVGEGAAEIERARTELLRQHPEFAAETVEDLARQLGITTSLTADDRARLQMMIDQGNAIEEQVTAQAKQEQIARRAAEAARETARERQETEEAAAQALREQQERAESAIQDLSSFYADLFSGSTGNIWDNFKHLGISAISEVAARWTLARLSGQSFDLAGTIGGMAQRGGLFGTLLGGLGGAGGIFGGAGGAAAGASGALVQGSATAGASGAAGSGGFLGAAAPWAIGAIAALQILPGLIGSLKTKKGSATLAESAGVLSVGDVTGNSKSRKAAASGALGNVIDALDGIAEQLGGTISGAGSVSIGMRKKKWRVDTSGQGRTKGSGVVDFGEDQEAAIRFAVGEALRDGVIAGISDASKRILASGQDLEQAIEKAVAIEQLPKLLKARLDPLGAAIDDIDAKYKKLADTLREGGASAEQIAQARQLWSLEREDAMKQIGAASKTLRDYLESLSTGPDSPLSPRRQREAAEASFAAYQSKLAGLTAGKAELDALRASGASADAIAAAEAAQRQRIAGFDQEGFTRAADLLLSTSRRTGASTDDFFDAWDRVRAITERAASLIEAATPAMSSKDPFAELTATAAQNTVNILDTQTGILNAINDNLAMIARNSTGGGNGASFIGGGRNYA